MSGDGVTPYEEYEYSGIYTGVAHWCNQVRFVRSMSFREFAHYDAGVRDTETVLLRTIKKFEAEYPDTARRYFDMKWTDYSL